MHVTESTHRQYSGIVEQREIEIVPVDGEGGFWEDRTGLLTCVRDTPPRVPAYSVRSGAGLAARRFKATSTRPRTRPSRFASWALSWFSSAVTL